MRKQRLKNGRIKTELGVALIHPTYREGLRAVLAAEQHGAGHHGTADK